MLLPEVGRVVRSRSKSENSSGSVSKPPTAVGAKMFPLNTFPQSLVQPPPPSGPRQIQHSHPGYRSNPAQGSQYLQCHCCWAWQVNLPRGLRKPGQVPRGQKMGVH